MICGTTLVTPIAAAMVTLELLMKLLKSCMLLNLGREIGTRSKRDSGR